MALEKAVKDLQDENLDALITAPINKKAMQLAGFKYPGHTEFISAEFNAPHSLMLMVSDDLRVGLATNHLPVAKVAPAINKDLILKKLIIFSETLKVDFGIEKPTIAVLGLNPHAGDEGAIGTEEAEHIRPAIEQAKEKGILAFGPFPADGFFGSAQFKKYDGILAMYHDQGLVPFKALSFGAGVNYTAGLPIVRTSPDHGTAYDIAGKGEADPRSFIKALYLAADIVGNQNNYLEMHEDSLERRKQRALQSETGDDEEIEEVPGD
jgi:4-hydroxythreonine-4-phosphate dehydrogenase